MTVTALLALAALFTLASPGVASVEERPEQAPRLLAGFGGPVGMAGFGGPVGISADRSGEENGGGGARDGSASVSVLPGEPPEEARPEEAPREVKRDDERRASDPPIAERPAAAEEGAEPPRDERLKLSIPELGLTNVNVGDSPEQSYLDREGIMHLSGTDFPWEEGDTNTYIAGHAIGYPGGRNPEVFRNLEDLRKGDLVVLRDSAGEAHNYRVYERLVVDPQDFWVTRPVAGKEIVSLQTCWPEPAFDKRLVVRAEKGRSDSR